MANVVAPVLRNPWIAPPTPAVASPTLRNATQAPNIPAGISGTGRGGLTVSVTPKVNTVAPIAYAQSQYQEPGDPFTAAAEGWVNATNAREQADEDQGKKDAIADALKDQPDLAKYVKSGVMDPADAIKIADTRKQLADKTSKDTQRKADISSYLEKLAPTDKRYEDLLGQWNSGAITEDDLGNRLSDMDKAASPTDDQRELSQINDERKASGQAALSLEDYLDEKKNGKPVPPPDPLAPVVGLDDKGLPDPDQQAAFLKTLDPGTAGLVKGIANYQMDIAKVTSLRGDQRQKLAALVQQYDPTFDMTQYGARAAMRKSITSGPYSLTLNSANLVIQHLDELQKAGDNLHNNGFTPLNAAGNAVKNVTGDPTITRFNEAKQAVGSELAKVFKGTGVASEDEVKGWQSTFDAASSPEQLKQAISTAVTLLKSRIDTVQSQFNSAMGHPLNFSYLTKHSRDVLTNLGIDPSALDPAAVQGDQGADQTTDQPPGTSDLADGTVVEGPDGKQYTVKGGQFVPMQAAPQPAAAPPPAPAGPVGTTDLPAPEGAIVQGPDGKQYKVVNGQLVPV